MYQPYTYRIQFIPTGEYYYGVRYAKNCCPSDLWVRYFTSCKKVKDLIKLHGAESFRVEIRKIFTSKEMAIKWESRVTAKVIHWPNYLNANSGKAFNHSKSRNGGNVAVEKKVGIHAMTSEEKSIAGKKGGKALAERKKLLGLTQNEIDGIQKRADIISERRNNGDWTEKELAAMESNSRRKKEGFWTENEIAGYDRVRNRRRNSDWTENEKEGFNRVSEHRKSGHWITNGSHNKFITSEETPEGWIRGFTRKKRI